VVGWGWGGRVTWCSMAWRDLCCTLVWQVRAMLTELLLPGMAAGMAASPQLRAWASLGSLRTSRTCLFAHALTRSPVSLTVVSGCIGLGQHVELVGDAGAQLAGGEVLLERAPVDAVEVIQEAGASCRGLQLPQACPLVVEQVEVAERSRGLRCQHREAQHHHRGGPGADCHDVRRTGYL
jgi:hypothetical protein